MNRFLTSTLVEKALYEAWAGKIPSLTHLRVFGFDSFMQIPKERRHNLNSKSRKCIFVKYKDGVKGYKLWNPTTRTTMYNRYLIFIEFRRTFETEEGREKKSEKLEFNWNKESHDSDEST